MMRDPPTRQTTSGRVSSGLQSLWSVCEAPLLSGKGISCTEESMSCLIETENAHFGENDDDDDISIVDQSAPRLRPPAHQQVRNIVDGIFTPFMNCVQPPLDACIAGAMQERDLFLHRQSSGGERNKNIALRVSPTLASASANSSVNSKQYSVTSSAGKNILSARSKQQLQASNSTNNLPNNAAFKRVNVNDVLCGRGNSISKHVGNLNFRDLIDANKGDYNTLTKKEKMLLARQIVDYVMYHTDPPGRFIARDSASGMWYDIGLPRSLEKTSQALREKSARVQGVAEKAACISYCVNNVVSFEEGASDSIEVESQFQDTSANELSRAITVKVNNHRNAPVKQPLCIVPEHLQKVYRHERIAVPSASYPNSSEFLTPAVSHYSSDEYQRHITLQSFGDSSASRLENAVSGTPGHHVAAPSGTGIALTSPSLRSLSFSGRPMTTVPTFASSPPRRATDQMPWTSAPMVTPNGYFSKDFVPTSETERSVKLPQEPMTETTDCSVESMFPVDVFENPDYRCEAGAYHGSPAIVQQGTSTISPLREQKHSKRQRLSQPSLDTSWFPSCVELDTSWESLNVSTSQPDEENILATQKLVEAIGSQLKLDELLSPSDLLQSYAGGRRRHEPLLRPPKATTALDTSADSADGMAALSSAAFLRLDESF